MPAVPVAALRTLVDELDAAHAGYLKWSRVDVPALGKAVTTLRALCDAAEQESKP